MRRELLVLASTSFFLATSRRQNIAVQLALDKLLDVRNSSNDSDLPADSASFIDSDLSESSGLFFENLTLDDSEPSRSRSLKDQDERATNASHQEHSHTPPENSVVEANATVALDTGQSERSSSYNSHGNVTPSKPTPSSFIAARQGISMISGAFARTFENSNVKSSHIIYGLCGGLLLGWCCCCAIQAVQNNPDLNDFDGDMADSSNSFVRIKRKVAEPARKIKQKAGDALRKSGYHRPHLRSFHGGHRDDQHSEGDGQDGDPGR